MQNMKTRSRRFWPLMVIIVSFQQSLTVGQEPKGELGSTMTFEQIMRKSHDNAHSRNSPPGLPFDASVSQVKTVTTADEPIPALKYRLYPSPRHLRAGSASVHLGRALLDFYQLPEATKSRWSEFERNWSVGIENVNELPKLLPAFEQVIIELRSMSECEDLTWDLRVRDIKGTAAFNVLLPEVQASRDLGRLLYYRAIDQMERKDYSGSIESIRIGYRLAELHGAGESIIQQLVGIAIESIMQDALFRLITTPDSPNLYWALATVPQPLGHMREAVLLELDGMEKLFPIFSEAESSSLDREGWNALWKKSLREIKELYSMSGGTEKVELTIPLSILAGAADAKRRLHRFGYDDQTLEGMPFERVVTLDALFEIRQTANEFAKTSLVPRTVPAEWFSGQRSASERMLQANDGSLGSVFTRLLIPAVDQSRVAETRSMMVHARLMTLEAIRMFASRHEGKLPTSLSQLTDAPPIPNPFTNAAFDYSSRDTGNFREVELAAKVPDQFSSIRELNVRFTK